VTFSTGCAAWPALLRAADPRVAATLRLGPELALELVATVIDGIGTGTEWSGEQLDQLGDLTQQLADKIRGVKEAGNQ
jgi:predicted metal-dependent hydrolase